MEPLVQEVLFGEAGVGDGLFFVVGVNEVLVYSAGFPEGESRVRIDDGRDAAVRTDFGDERGLKERWLLKQVREGVGSELAIAYLLQVTEVHKLDLIGEFELL